MTANAPADRDAASRLVATEEHAWTAIRTQHLDVPYDVMVVASGSDPYGKRLNLGHFAFGKLIDQATDRPESWSAAKASPQPGDAAHWLLSSGTCRPAAQQPALLFQLPWRGTALYGNGRRAVLPRPRDLQQRADSYLSGPGIGFFSALRSSRGVVALGY